MSDKMRGRLKLSLAGRYSWQPVPFALVTHPHFKGLELSVLAGEMQLVGLRIGDPPNILKPDRHFQPR